MRLRSSVRHAEPPISSPWQANDSAEPDVDPLATGSTPYAFMPGGGNDPEDADVQGQFLADSPAAERIREMRAALLARKDIPPGTPMTIIVADADRKRSTSMLAADLAAASAHLGYLVLLVDANLTWPDQHNIFRVPNEHGVSDMADWLNNGEAAVQQTAVRGLHLLPAGPTVDNPAETIERLELCDRLRRLGREFDMIVIDATAEDLPGAAAAGVGADGVIVAVRRNKTPIAAIRRTVLAFSDRKVDSLGLVMVA